MRVGVGVEGGRDGAAFSSVWVGIITLVDWRKLSRSTQQVRERQTFSFCGTGGGRRCLSPLDW